MTGPEGNSEFCFSKTLNFPWGEAEGNIQVEGKQNSLFAAKPVIVIPASVLLYLPAQRSKKNYEEVIFLRPTGSQNLVQLQGAQPDNVWVKSCCFPLELVSFIHPRELVSFDPRHVTHSSPIAKHIWVGRYNKINK